MGEKAKRKMCEEWTKKKASTDTNAGKHGFYDQLKEGHYVLLRSENVQRRRKRSRNRDWGLKTNARSKSIVIL